MARSRVVVVTSVALTVVLGMLVIVGWVGFNRLKNSQDALERASGAVASYARVQVAVANEVAAEAAYQRASGEVTKARLLDALGVPSRAVRDTDLDAAEQAYLLVLQDRYASQVRLALADGSSAGDAVAGPTVLELQGQLADGQRRALRELDRATAHQRGIVGAMTWRAPLALLISGVVLALCWRLLVRHIGRAMARAHQSEELAMRDPLTGLANRRFFERELTTALAAHDPDCAVLMLDLDGFKSINDTWGHDVGDQVLATVADRLRSTVRSSDLVARIGGDEFAVLARPALHAESLKDRMEEAVARPMPVSGVLLHPSASVGCGTVVAGATQADILRAADLELYDVKRARSGSGRRLGARQISS